MQSIRWLLLAAVLPISCGYSAEQYLERGNEYLEQGEYADAVIQFQKALQKDPVLTEARYRLGVAELERKNYAEAYLALRDSLLGEISNRADAQTKLGNLALILYLNSRERPEHARELLRSVTADLLEDDPDSFDGLRLQGALARIEGQIPLALESFEKALEVRPLDRDATLGYVQSLYAVGELDRAEELARELIEKHPDWSPIYDVLFLQYLAAGRSEDARGLLELKIRNNPEETLYAVQLADYYLSETADREAFEATLQSLLDNSSYPNRWLAVGDVRARLGQWDEALRVYEQGLEASPEDAAIYQKRMGAIRIVQGNPEEAWRLATEAAEADPDDQEARLMKANLMLTAGAGEGLEGSMREYQRLLEDDPGNAVAMVNLARAHLRRGESSEALRLLVAAVKARPDFPEARLFLGNVQLRAGEPQQAMEQAEATLELAPGSPAALLLRAQALVGLEQFGPARTALEQLARQYPDSPEIQTELATLAVREGNQREAAAIFTELRNQGTGGAAATAGLAETYSGAGQYDRAVAVLREELEKSPGSVSLRELLAATLGRAGDHEGAIREYQTLVSANPESPDLRLGLGSVYRKAGDAEAAIREFSRAAEQAPEQPLAWLLLAVTSQNAGHTEQAVNAYRKVIELEPDNAAACNNLAFALADEERDLDEALELANRAVRQAPEEPNLQGTLGYVYLKKGMYPSALSLFENLVKRRQGDPGFRINLGKALLATGQKERARAELTAAMSYQPSEQQQKEIQELLAENR